MTIYQHARDLAEEIMKTEEAINYFSLRGTSETNSKQYEKAQIEYYNLVNEIFSIIKYSIGEEDILENTPASSCNRNCNGCNK